MDAMTGSNFEDIKMSRKGKVIPLGAMSSGIKIHDTIVPIDTNLLYQRILSTTTNFEDLRECFKYELSPVPQTLFDEFGMRKTVKSSLYSAFNEMKNHLPDFKKARL